MKRLSKTIIALGVLSICAAATPKRAEAGLVFLGTAGYFHLYPDGSMNSTPVGVTSTIAAGLVVLGSGILTASAILIVLDADQSQTSLHAQIATALGQRFSFLADENEALNALSDAIAQDVPKHLSAPFAVSMSDSQVREILTPTALTEAQIETVSNVLR